MEGPIILFIASSPVSMLLDQKACTFPVDSSTSRNSFSCENAMDAADVRGLLVTVVFVSHISFLVSYSLIPILQLVLLYRICTSCNLLFSGQVLY
jgi:hypothetical protein